MIRALKNLLESKAVHYILFGIFVCAFNIALPESTAAAKKVRFTTKIPEIYKPFLSGIGSLQVGSNIYCTAFCVSKSTIATAQHCVLTKNERWRSSALNIRFSLELKGKVKTSKILGRSTAERRPNIAYGLKSWSRRSTLYGGKKRNRKKLESDWALIKLEHKICTITLPINNLIGLKFRTRPGKDFAAAVSAEKFNTRKRRNRWTFRGKCRFLEKVYLSYEALIVHDCEGRPGISGAPFFLRDDDGNFGVVALDTGDANTKDHGRVGTATKISSFAESIEHFETHKRVSSSEKIMKMQEILKERKLLDGKIDGVFGQKTRWALTGLERSIGLPELGVPTTLTL